MLPLILASTSPRRAQLLEQAGLEPEIIAPDADETPRKGERPDALVRRLARAKARSVIGAALARHSRCLILAADTIVVAPAPSRRGWAILGKPADAAAARRMLKRLAGREHRVLTGYTWVEAQAEPGAVAPRTRERTRVVRTLVRLRRLSPAVIDQYVATRESMDKAGAYAAQGLGGAMIEAFKGSFTNVVGLPVSHALADLEREFKVPFLSWASRP